MLEYEFIVAKRANQFGEWRVRCYAVTGSKVLRCIECECFETCQDDAIASCNALQAAELKRRESFLPEYSI